MRYSIYMAHEFSTTEIVDMMLTLERAVDTLIEMHEDHLAFEINSVITRLNERMWGG